MKSCVCVRSLGLAAAVVVGAWLPIASFGGGREIPKGDAPTAKAIIEKAVAWHGGAKALSRDTSMIRVEESEMILDGEKIPIKSEWQYQPPNKWAFQALVKIGTLQLNVHQAIVGKDGWVKFGPANAADLPADQVRGQIWEHNNHLRNILLLTEAERDFDISAPKADRFADRDSWKIDFTSKANKSVVTVFFDKSTGQVLGDDSLRVIATLGNDKVREKPAMFRCVFKEYATVDGAKMPTTMTILREGTPVVEVRKAEIRFVDSIDPKLFAKPK